MWRKRRLANFCQGSFCRLKSVVTTLAIIRCTLYYTTGRDNLDSVIAGKTSAHGAELSLPIIMEIALGPCVAVEIRLSGSATGQGQRCHGPTTWKPLWCAIQMTARLKPSSSHTTTTVFSWRSANRFDATRAFTGSSVPISDNELEIDRLPLANQISDSPGLHETPIGVLQRVPDRLITK